MNWEIFFYMFLGWLVGWAIKYAVVGLREWDRLFHPERLVSDTTGPYSVFARPLLLGVFDHA